MRSRERLIEVLRTVNVCPGIRQSDVTYLGAASVLLEGNVALSSPPLLHLRVMAVDHSSPHIRELAAEALHYGAPNGA